MYKKNFVFTIKAALFFVQKKRGRNRVARGNNHALPNPTLCSLIGF